MNILKKSIMTFIAISSISVIPVMANQDIAAQLDQWYKNVFQESSQTTSQVKEKGLQELKNTVKEQQAAEKEAAAAKIQSFLQNSLDTSKDNISNYQKDYISRLEKAKADLEKSISGEPTKKEKAKVDSEITDDVEDVLSEVLGE